MKSLNFNDGKIRLCINEDETRVISFSPEDITFVERLYSVFGKLEDKQKELEEKEKELSKNKEVDNFGFPLNIKEKISLTKETCSYMRQEIDSVFGEGTSQKVFGDTNTLDMFKQFFEGITPYIQKVREDKIKKYKSDTSRNVMQ